MRPRILHINSHLGVGGIEKFISLFTLGSQQRVENIIALRWKMVSYRFGGTLISLGAEKIIDYDSYIEALGKPDIVSQLKLAVLNVYLNLAYLTVVIWTKPDFVVVHGLSRFKHAWLVSLWPYHKLVYVAHNVIRRKDLNPYVRWLLRKRVYKVISVSWGVADEYLKVGVPKNKLEVIYSGVDLQVVTSRTKEGVDDFLFEKENLYVANVGRFSREKGQQHLLRIAKHLILEKKYHRLRFVFMGGHGLLENDLRKYAKDLGIDKCTYFLGFKENPYKYISRCDILVQCSLSEGFGLVLIESLACGVPIVSTDCDAGPRELLLPSTDYSQLLVDRFVIGKYGILTPTMEDRWLPVIDPLTAKERLNAEAIEYLISDDTLRDRLSRQGREIAKKYDISTIVDSYLKSFGVPVEI